MIDLCKALHSHNPGLPSLGSIAIITPYSGQRREIRKLLKDELGAASTSHIEVGTVDGFQGQESDVVIFSSVVSGGSIGFLSERERMNVALTRARHSLFVLGKADTLRRNRDWDALLRHAAQRKRLVPAQQVIKSQYALPAMAQGGGRSAAGRPPLEQGRRAPLPSDRAPARQRGGAGGAAQPPRRTNLKFHVCWTCRQQGHTARECPQGEPPARAVAEFDSRAAGRGGGGGGKRRAGSDAGSRGKARKLAGGRLPT